MTRHLAGLDLTGWRDSVTRNWRPHGEDEDDDGAVEHVDAGVAPCAVMMGRDSAALRAVGGPQATLAPHGRGTGWGDIGAPGRRRSVDSALRQLLAGPDGAAQETISAAARALCLGADQAVVTIPDVPEMNDAAQQRILDALREGGVRRPFLLWRSVALCLSALTGAQPPPPGAMVGIVEHDGAGLRLQTLRVQAAAVQGGVTAPERRQAGVLISWEGALAHRRDAAIQTLLASERALDATAARLADTPTLMALGEAPQTELVRLANGSWVRLSPPTPPTELDIAMPSDIATQLKNCTRVIFDTPMSDAPREALRRALSAASPAPVSLAPSGAAAHGAFEAGERLSRGAPVYFDFLPQVSVVVQRKHRAVFASLVPEGATVAANETYRTVDPPVFVVSKGMEKLEVYLRKEGEPKVRCATVALPARPNADERVTVELEQRPAQGLARIEVRAERWAPLARAPIRLDWARMVEDPRGEEELLDALSQRAPHVPERLVLPCDAIAWREPAGLNALLPRNADRREPRYKDVADFLSAGVLRLQDGQVGKKGVGERFRAVDSDGRTPEGVDCSALQRVIDAAVRELLDCAAHHRPPPDNAPLRVLTWCFSRCPVPIQTELIAAAADDWHPWAAPAGASVVIWQGLGRVTDDPRRIRQVLDLLFARAPEQWSQQHCACIAFMMTRRDETFDVMSETEAVALCRVITRMLERDRGGPYGQLFAYHLQMAGGLLRRRRVEPFAWMPEMDHDARALLSVLERLAAEMRQAGLRGYGSRFATKIERTTAVAQWLSGVGGGPVTLRELFE